MPGQDCCSAFRWDVYLAPPSRLFLAFLGGQRPVGVVASLVSHECLLGKKGAGTARGVARKPLVLVCLADVVVQVPLVQVEAAAALVRTAEHLPVALVRLLVQLHARLGVEDPVAPPAGEALLMVHLTVLPQKAPLGKDPLTSAYSALVALVTTLMGLQSTWQQERPVAPRLRARIRQHLGVLVAVNFQLLVLDKRFGTVLALKSPLLVRDADVLVERVLGRELLPTLLEGALEIFRRSCLGLGCVHHLDVPCQVVLPGVLAGAPLESARKGPLVRVETHVPVESGSLGEHCIATFVRAHEN